MVVMVVITIMVVYVDVAIGKSKTVERFREDPGR